MSRVFDNNAANYLAPASNAAYALVVPFSVAAWVKRNSIGSGDTIVGHTNTTFFFLLSTGDKIEAEGGSSKFGTTSITNDSTWHHIAFTVDAAGNWNMYLDGANDGSGAGFNVPGTNGVITVGQVAGILPMDGKMAYLAMWSTELTSGNITTLQTSTTPESVGSGCIASWHLSTSALTDSSATANDLVVTGTVAFDADNPSIGGAGPSSFSKPMWPMSFF